MKKLETFNEFLKESYETTTGQQTPNSPLAKLTLSLLAIRDQAHLFHWQTKSYAEHVALGEFYETFIDKVDSLMENIIAKTARPEISNGTITLSGYGTESLNAFLLKTKTTLKTEMLEAISPKNNEEIWNIVEELKAMVNKLEYLLTLK